MAGGKLNRGLKLTDILVTVVIAIVFSIIYKIWGPLYSLVQPLGLQLDQAVYGMWFIAATVAALLIRKPGVALLAELAASVGEVILASQFGIQAFIYGVVQGVGAELFFLLFGYKRYTLSVACLAGIGASVGSFILDFVYGYMADLSLWVVVLQLVVRTAGAIVIAGIFAYYLVRALEVAGVATLVRPASKEDYNALDD